jgi:PAS domain S-box-containing protein
VEQLIRVNKQISQVKCMAIFQFDLRSFSPDVLQSILCVSPTIIIDNELYDNSPQFSNLSELKLGYQINSLKERKRLMQALREEEQHSRLIGAVCRAIIEQAAEGLCVYHETPVYPYLEFTMWNERMEEITGYTREEINHLDWWQSVGGKMPTGGREITRKDGQKRTISISSSFIDDGERPVSVLAMVYDITERKNVEYALRRYSEQLEALVEERTDQLKKAERLAAIGETAAMIGHDLRNPLQALYCMIYLARERYSPRSKSLPEGQHSLEDILDDMEDSADYMNKIVSDIQDYAKTMNLNLIETDVSFFIREILSTISIPDDVRVFIQIDGKPLKLNIDPEKMKRVIINLVTNSINAMPQGGRIFISVRRVGNLARLSVKDTGVGIPEEILPKLFQPLFTTRSKGVGLGLSVCKRMIDTMKGNIAINSKVGEGTEVIVEIPMGQDDG